MDQNEFYDLEDRRYVSPTISRDAQLGFVNTLRDTMGQNTAQINAQTERLGTNVPSSMGGLAGSGSYFTQRYQTTPLEARANTLKATAQAKALNDLMGNYERQMANRAQQAYRGAKRRASTSGGGGDDGLPDNVDITNTGEETLVDVDEGDITLTEPKTSANAGTETINAIAGMTGGGQIPNSSSTGYYYDLNGQRTAFTALNTPYGTGIDTPTRSYTKDAAREFLQDIMRRGGRIYNQYGKDITSIALLNMGLY